MDSIRQILNRLTEQKVEFVIIGGVAGILHGAARSTLDVDVCAKLEGENLSRILVALQGLNPRWRMHPARPPLADDPARLKGFHHLYLETDLGILDVLTEVTGLGNFDAVAERSIEIEIDRMKFRVLSLDALIESKRAAGRRKDLEALRELEIIREQLRKQKGES